MIDIENIKIQFKKYVSNYDTTNGRISLKIAHISRVAENSKIIATNLKLSNEEIKLAQAIGYFHDIGRFEQVKIANTFSDKESKINHGELSVQILFKNNFIRDFITENIYDNIIKAAVLNHNRKEIEKGLNEKELLFSKIIRDADKLDILYNIGLPEESLESIFWYPSFEVEQINEELINEFKQEKPISYSKIENNADVILIFYAYIFDIYFKDTLKIIYENKYLETFSNRLFKAFKNEKIHKQIQEALTFCTKYLEKSL